MDRAYRSKFKRFSILAALALVVFLLGLSSTAVEYIYADRIYLFTSIVQRFISSVVPFAIGDVLYLILIAYVLKRVFVFGKKAFRGALKKTDRINLPLGVLNFSLILYLTFKILWGLNYSRPSIAEQLGISDEKYNTEQLISMGKFFILRLNKLQSVEKPRFTMDQLKEIAVKGYLKMEKTNAFFDYHIPSVKPVMNSWIVTKIGIEGYYNPLSGEANINRMIPSVALPFVTCHEIAHQLGIGREDEANLIGYLVASNSSNPYFQYSANYTVLKNILFEIRIKSPEDYDKLYATINAGTIRDFEADRDFWRKHNNDMFDYMGAAFDRFLKLNNQQKGTDSYQDIVLWLYNIHKKDL
jgi:hypothetical protein